MNSTKDHDNAEPHAGFEALLTEMSGEGVSARTIGRILDDLAVAAPVGLSRQQLLSAHSAGSLAKALGILGEKGGGEGLVRLHWSDARSRGGGRPGGRPAGHYLLGSPRWAMLGVHITVEDGQPSKVTGALCDLDGQRLWDASIGLPAINLSKGDETRPWQLLASKIAELTRQMLAKYPDRKILGLGVEVPGHVWRGEVLMADHSGYGNQVDTIRLAQSIRDALINQGHKEIASRVVLENDVNLIAIREAYNYKQPMSAHGVVVAVFDQGVGAGLLGGKRQIISGSHGAAGEPGHLPVFVEAGEPKQPKRLARLTTEQEKSTERLPFEAMCSCGGVQHVDCYATPDRLLGEIDRNAGRPHGEADSQANILERFAEVAQRPAYTSDGKLTNEGEVFWKGGYALGYGLLSLITTLNPDRLLVLVPAPLAGERLLTSVGTGDGSAAGLYRQAMEYVVSANAMTTTAEDARADGGWLEVKPLIPDEKGGAIKAARNAAIGVLDAFIAHAVGRDECAEKEDLLPEVAVSGFDAGSKREQLKRISKDLHALVVTVDPEGLIHDGAPRDEYLTEEAELLALIKNEDVAITEDRVLQVFRGQFPNTNLRNDHAKLRRLTEGTADLQTKLTGRVHLRAVV